jgi:hypothetical protein
MVAGHFGIAAAVKAKERAVPLWALMLATQWLDVLFVPLLMLGIERLDPVVGTAGGYGEVIIHADYTHSLVGAAIIAAVTGHFARMIWNKRTGIVIMLVVFSHWLIDLVMHRGDMPMLPGNPGGWQRVGFGLWRSPNASALLELIFVVGGAALYFNAARRTAGGVTSRVLLASGLLLVSGVIVLVLNFYGN